MQYLHTEGKNIVQDDGRRIFLRGTCIGTWLNLESFMTGHVGNESHVRDTLALVLGQERADAFIGGFLDNFITEDDFRYMAQIGMNVARIALNYRYLEDDAAPGAYKPDGFRYLDKAVEWAKKYGVYIIVDLHALPGWQNNRWHSDNPHGYTLLFSQKTYRTRAIELWRHIARHYVQEPAIAGYDLMNEPEAADARELTGLYEEIIAAIRETGDRHIIFLEGNDRGMDFDGLERLEGENVGFSSHNYNSVTLNSCAYPGMLLGKYTDRSTLERMFLHRTGWLLKRNAPSWVGEFSTIFDGDVYHPTQADVARLKALRDELEIFNAYEQHWTIWSYKDIGYVGLSVPDPECEYMRRVRPIVELKNKLSLDCFISRRHGGVFRHAQDLIDEMATLIGDTLHDFSLDYSSLIKTLGEEAISSALSRFLSPLYAQAFADMSAEEIRQMMAEAFLWKNTVRRGSLEEILSAACRA